MAREVFIVEGEGQAVLFAPLHGLIMEIDAEEREKTAALINQPQFTFRQLAEIFPEIEEDRLFPQPAEVGKAVENEGEFRPDSVMLFPTLGCHLRCTYCYSRGGEQKVNMDREVAEAAIDFVVENAASKRLGECSLEFHGGGEPTWNWPVFQFSLRYLQDKARGQGLKPEVSIATNGILSSQQVDWIAENIQKIQVSLDGTADIQNSQRPTAGNGGSFPIVSRTISSLLARGVGVAIHSVITERSMGRIPEIVRFFAENFPGASVQLEPAFPCGRGLTTGERFPSIDLFVKGFIEALEIASSFGMEVTYSGANPRLTEFREYFCGVTGPNFIVTPTGLVTACNEVAEMGQPFAEYFIYGHLDRQSKRFVFDYEKIRRLRSYNAMGHPECGECFARFYCAGECLIKNLDRSGTSKPSLLNPRCTINRDLTRHFVIGHIRSKKEGDE